MAFDENDCFFTHTLDESSIYDITLVMIPAFNFDEILGAIILALKVLEKITISTPSDSFSILRATDFPSFFRILG